MRESEQHIFKWCQETINTDTLDQKLMSKPDEQGLLRAHGRPENIRSLPNEMRNPIILPKGHQMVNLLLKHLHEKRAHCGDKSLIYESRKRFWIVEVRKMAKQLVTDKSTDTFLMAFRRFASLRGHPVNCWSDFGTNFVGAQQYLREVMRDWDIPKIQSVLSNEFSCTFKWEWNVPRASHQNGVVESLIKSVRQALAASSKKQSFTEEQWRTHLAEVTYLVNSRPLYPSSDGIWESPPATPNDLLIGHHFPPPVPEQE